ncbi:MAG: hypothetical protein ABW321_10715 [Polyangiales bacterium]
MGVGGERAWVVVWAGLAALAALFGCDYVADLGRACPRGEPACAPSVEQSATSDAAAPLHGDDAAAELHDAAAASDAAVSSREGAAGGAPDAGGERGAASPTAACRAVAFTFFACASATEMVGAPVLRAGHAYTLRIHGNYNVPTMFQAQGATSACTAVQLGQVELEMGAPQGGLCLHPTEDLALLLTVGAGDPAAWTRQPVAEVCDGCE